MEDMCSIAAELLSSAIQMKLHTSDQLSNSALLFQIPDDSPDGEVKEPPWSISDSSDDSAGRQSSVPVEPSSPLLMVTQGRFY